MKKVIIISLLTIIIIAQTSVAQRMYNPINGHLYEKIDTPMTWNDAKAYCESLGGYLATVTSQEEQDWIWSNLEPYDYYFGASDIEEEGVWKWVTGEPWDYTNWDTGQPDNSGPDGEDVIHWWILSGLWNDIPGNGLRRFVCEYEPSGEIFVSPDGSDDGDGSAEHPYLTIQHGIDMSPRKDAVVRVLPGTYSENIILDSDLVVLGSGADQTIITAAGGNVVSATDEVDVTLAGFTIDGQGTASNGILCSGVTTMMMINDNIITGATKGIRCSDSANVSIWSNAIRQNIEDGVYCDGSASVDIKNNTITENGEHGIQCRSTTTGTIQNNVIRSNNQEGIYVHDSASPTIHENTVTENKGYGIMVSGSSTPTITENHISQNGWGLWFRDNSVAKLYHNTIELNQAEGIACSSSGGTQIVGNAISYNNAGFYCNDVSNPFISENLIHSNRGVALYATHSSVPTMIRNIIRNNGGGISMDMSSLPIIGGSLTNANIIVDNGWAISNSTDNIINATYNYWGTTDEDEIAAMMINEGDGSIDFIPFVGDPRIVGDASGDGTISALDAAYILQFTVGLIDKLPVSMSKSPQHIVPRDYELSLPNLAVKPNERFCAPIAIGDATGLNYGGVIIKYDPSVLKVIDVAVLGMLSGSYWKANTLTGEVRFAFATPTHPYPSKEGIPMEGKGNILMIDFEALPNTTGRESPLIFDTVEIPESRNIKTINGSVTILPERTMLLQNYPNPFNPETWLPFQLTQDAVVILRIYNQNGQLVRTLHLGAMPAGTYTSKDKAAYWDGRDAAGEEVASGVYFYTLLAGDFLATRKLVVLK